MEVKRVGLREGRKVGGGGNETLYRRASREEEDTELGENEVTGTQWGQRRKTELGETGSLKHFLKDMMIDGHVGKCLLTQH